MNFLTIRKKESKASKSLENKSQIGIKNSDIGCRFIGQWNTILSEMHFKFAILRTKIILSPRFCITLFHRKIVIFYCLFRGYQHPESDNVAQTAARLFWNLAIGSSRLVVPTIILGFLDLMDFIADFHYVLRNIMENMLVFMTLTKFGVRRIKCQPLSKFLTEAEDDYIIDNYKTKEVRLIFMKYNNIASKFIVPTYYYVPMNDTPVTEAVRCEELYLWLHTPIFRHNICPFRLRRNLLACTGFHLTGQLAILKCRVKEFLKNNHDSHGRVRQMILRHYRLISIRKMSLQKITYPPRICFRLADTSEDSFNIVTCLHMVGSTILLCTSYQTSYQMLFVRIRYSMQIYTSRRLINNFIFFRRDQKKSIYLRFLYTFAFCCAHCIVIVYRRSLWCIDGQCLIEECDAIYRCDWYELSTIDLKSLCISMVRAGKPLQLTGAKFGVVSSCTFTDVNHSEDIDGVLISSTNIYANKRENDIEEQLKSKRFRRDKLKSRSRAQKWNLENFANN
ncbi:LOW QUALITY PROTEIN: odorant receptor 13a-like isoform X2 [Vespula squamosa]|uniref:Odorant receptor 13a-like isoform X2 n=1 Tax=Vespula squamosa TaxID=30214 RepID=A0ABD2BQ02_VESSQ